MTDTYLQVDCKTGAVTVTNPVIFKELVQAVAQTSPLTDPAIATLAADAASQQRILAAYRHPVNVITGLQPAGSATDLSEPTIAAANSHFLHPRHGGTVFQPLPFAASHITHSSMTLRADTLQFVTESLHARQPIPCGTLPHQYHSHVSGSTVPSLSTQVEVAGSRDDMDAQCMYSTAGHMPGWYHPGPDDVGTHSHGLMGVGLWCGVAPHEPQHSCRDVIRSPTFWWTIQSPGVSVLVPAGWSLCHRSITATLLLTARWPHRCRNDTADSSSATRRSARRAVTAETTNTTAAPRPVSPTPPVQSKRSIPTAPATEHLPAKCQRAVQATTSNAVSRGQTSARTVPLRTARTASTQSPRSRSDADDSTDDDVSEGTQPLQTPRKRTRSNSSPLPTVDSPAAARLEVMLRSIKRMPRRPASEDADAGAREHQRLTATTAAGLSSSLLWVTGADLLANLSARQPSDDDLVQACVVCVQQSQKAVSVVWEAEIRLSRLVGELYRRRANDFFTLTGVAAQLKQLHVGDKAKLYTYIELDKLLTVFPTLASQLDTRHIGSLQMLTNLRAHAKEICEFLCLQARAPVHERSSVVAEWLEDADVSDAAIATVVNPKLLIRVYDFMRAEVPQLAIATGLSNTGGAYGELTQASTARLLDLLDRHLKLRDGAVQPQHHLIGLGAAFSSVATHVAIELPALRVTAIEQQAPQVEAARQRHTKLRRSHPSLLTNIAYLDGDFMSAEHRSLLEGGTILYMFDKTFSVATLDQLTQFLQSPTAQWCYVISSRKPGYWPPSLQLVDKLGHLATSQSGSTHTLYLYRRAQ